MVLRHRFATPTSLALYVVDSKGTRVYSLDKQ